eukprot:TRINITY_DN8859_c0_g1_i1.p1 TRINITY_DN8859_c0_g1~~TRINITY_DN8859_c0_g1_i1.p1  ORF type:complete len:238 (+),score=34.40 TRINITY_DN8859_c0_g1_i1:45-758(+)
MEQDKLERELGFGFEVPMGPAAMEGFIEKRGNRFKTWRRRYVSLYNLANGPIPGMYYYLSRTDCVLGRALGIVSLKGAEVIECELSRRKYAFKIWSPIDNRTWFFSCASELQKQIWVDAIKEVTHQEGWDKPVVKKAIDNPLFHIKSARNSDSSFCTDSDSSESLEQLTQTLENYLNQKYSSEDDEETLESLSDKLESCCADFHNTTKMEKRLSQNIDVPVQKLVHKHKQERLSYSV